MGHPVFLLVDFGVGIILRWLDKDKGGVAGARAGGEHGLSPPCAGTTRLQRTHFKLRFAKLKHKSKLADRVVYLQKKPEAGYSTIKAATSTKATLWLGSEMKICCDKKKSKQESPMLNPSGGAECTNLLTSSQRGELGHFSAH